MGSGRSQTKVLVRGATRAMFMRDPVLRRWFNSHEGRPKGAPRALARGVIGAHWTPVAPVSKRTQVRIERLRHQWAPVRIGSLEKASVTQLASRSLEASANPARIQVVSASTATSRASRRLGLPLSAGCGAFVPGGAAVVVPGVCDGGDDRCVPRRLGISAGTGPTWFILSGNGEAAPEVFDGR
jgi:hypothetical protein